MRYDAFFRSLGFKGLINTAVKQPPLKHSKELVGLKIFYEYLMIQYESKHVAKYMCMCICVCVPENFKS